MLSNKVFHKAIVLVAIAILTLLGCEKLGRKSPTASDSAVEAQFLGKSSMPASLSSSPDIFVNTTSDVADFIGAQQVGDLPGSDGLVSLREAIIAANNTTGPKVIGFNIPTSDAGFDGTVFTIKPLSRPEVLGGGETTINGATHTNFTGNTNPNGPEVVLDGSLISGGADGIPIHSDSNVIHSLVISGFQHNPGVCCGIGIDITHQASGNIITGCFIGLDASGAVALGNDATGVTMSRGATNNRIGGTTPPERNVISGNGHGVHIIGASGNLVQGNFIGTNVMGSTAIGNNQGVTIEDGANNNRIIGNRISFNSQNGVFVDPAAVNNSISHNRIFSNSGLGIELGGDGVTPNDPGDTDTGANNLMNFPVLTSAKATPGQLIVKGMIDTSDPKSVTVEFFANPIPAPGGDPSGHGEGAIFLGTKKPNAQGKFTAALPPVASGTFITATATDAAGNSSEFAANIVAQ